MLVNGFEITNQKTILQEIANFYQNRYSRKICVTEMECDQFLSTVNVSTLTPEEANSCEGKFSRNEVYTALKGISWACLRREWHQIKRLVMMAYRQNFT